MLTKIVKNPAKATAPKYEIYCSNTQTWQYFTVLYPHFFCRDQVIRATGSVISSKPDLEQCCWRSATKNTMTVHNAKEKKAQKLKVAGKQDGR